MMMTTRSKKNKTTVTINPQAFSYDVLPLDLVMEIIGRLPVKSVARFLIVSKLWARTIRSRDLSFPLGSCSSQPRFLIALSGVDREGGYIGKEDWYLFSSSSFLSRSLCPLPNSYQRIAYRSNYVNGLICIGCGQEKFIVNPTTGKSIALPRVRTKRSLARSFFGYDSVSDEYKVLCMTEAMIGPNQEGAPSQHQIFTLGARKKSWRMVECSIPHRPCSNSVCMDGVIYYAAKTGTEGSLLRFDLRSEKFYLITGVTPEIALPEGPYKYVMVLNYHGKVAISNKTSAYVFDVWVMDQNAEERKWLKQLTFSFAPWKSIFNYTLDIKGINQTTGEFILAPDTYTYTYDVYVVLYNHYTDTFRKIKVPGTAKYDFIRRNHGTEIFISDYIESVRFL